MQVPYKDVGIFINVSDTSFWLKDDSGPTTMQWKLDPLTRAVHETEARWWVPDADISDVTINVSISPGSKFLDQVWSFYWSSNGFGYLQMCTMGERDFTRHSFVFS